MRTIGHRYVDPLDQVWLATAARIGLRVERSPAAYASTDGAGTLVIGTGDTLDADDCLAQMIVHELCHSLVQGRAAFEQPDWGLDNTSDRDMVRERACLRLQATLLAEYGLRQVLAPTTDHRAFYDALPADALAPRGEPSVTLAILGLQRADDPPWAPHLRAALEATADVARTAAAFATEADPAPPLWQLWQPAPARHPIGFPAALSAAPADDPGAAPGNASRTCGTCAWHYTGGRDGALSRCRQAGGARVQPAWPACDLWEGDLGCLACGACCRAAYDSVTVTRRDPVVRRHPALVVDRGTYLELQRVPERPGPGTRCAALQGGEDGAPYTCAIYAERPRTCRDFQRGGEHCLTARQRVGLSR